MLPIASSEIPLQSLGHVDQNEVQHDFFGHVTTLVLPLASHHANGVISGTLHFLDQDN